MLQMNELSESLVERDVCTINALLKHLQESTDGAETFAAHYWIHSAGELEHLAEVLSAWVHHEQIVL